VTLPTGAKTLFFSFKTTDSTLVNVLNLAITVQLKKVTNSILTVSGVDIDLGSDLHDGLWHNVVLVVKANDDVDVYIDADTSPISSNAPTASTGGSGDFIIGGSNLSLFGVRAISGEVNINNYQVNYLNKDITDNNGNVFYEAV
jgi:hypothetical protein